MVHRKKILKDNNGFTLVEMIVVVVIIGILLAVMVPGMTRYIDRAKEKQLEVNARAVYLAYQMEFSEAYAGQNTADPMSVKAAVDALFTSDYIKGLIGIESDVVYSVSDVKLDAQGTISEFTYSEGSSAVTYTNGTWEMKK